MFSLDAVEAGKGDALVVRWGEKSDPKIMLIDGGPASTWDRNLAPHLRSSAHVDLNEPGARIRIPLAVVSHVDADHITGVIDLIREMQHPVDGLTPIELDCLWHNAFSDTELADDVPADIVEEASLESGTLVGCNRSGAAAATIASIPQGRTLAGYVDSIGVERNTHFANRFVTAAGSAQGPIEIQGLGLQVVCPNDRLLENLRQAWKRAVDAEGRTRVRETSAAARRALAAAFDDRSVPNQSSIVLLARHDEKSMLLTGDVRGDHLLAGLESAGLLGDHPLEVDLFKVPHHGSIHSNDSKLYQHVVARHYVISGNGQHGNPHPSVLKMILEHRGDREITLWLTNRPGDRENHGNEDERANARSAQELLDAAVEEDAVSVRYREAGTHAVTVSLS